MIIHLYHACHHHVDKVIFALLLVKLLCVTGVEHQNLNGILIVGQSVLQIQTVHITKLVLVTNVSIHALDHVVLMPTVHVCTTLLFAHVLMEWLEIHLNIVHRHHQVEICISIG